MTPTPIFEAQNLRKHFVLAGSSNPIASISGRKGRPILHAVDDVSLSIMPGEAVGLVGKSGCGKSNSCPGGESPYGSHIRQHQDQRKRCIRHERGALCALGSSAADPDGLSGSYREPQPAFQRIRHHCGSRPPAVQPRPGRSRLVWKRPRKPSTFRSNCSAAFRISCQAGRRPALGLRAQWPSSHDFWSWMNRHRRSTYRCRQPFSSSWPSCGETQGWRFSS